MQIEAWEQTDIAKALNGAAAADAEDEETKSNGLHAQGTPKVALAVSHLE